MSDPLHRLPGPDLPGWAGFGIYVAQDLTGLVKIGSTRQLHRRLGVLNREAKHDGRGGVRLLYWFPCPQGRPIEQEAHWRMGRYRTARRINDQTHRSREWYEFTATLIRRLPKFLRRTAADCCRPITWR